MEQTLAGLPQRTSQPLPIKEEGCKGRMRIPIVCFLFYTSLERALRWMLACTSLPLFVTDGLIANRFVLTFYRPPQPQKVALIMPRGASGHPAIPLA